MRSTGPPKSQAAAYAMEVQITADGRRGLRILRGCHGDPHQYGDLHRAQLTASWLVSLGTPTTKTSCRAHPPVIDTYIVRVAPVYPRGGQRSAAGGAGDSCGRSLRTTLVDIVGETRLHPTWSLVPVPWVFALLRMAQATAAIKGRTILPTHQDAAVPVWRIVSSSGDIQG